MKVELVNHVLNITLDGWLGAFIVALALGLLYFLVSVPRSLANIAREMRRPVGCDVIRPVRKV